jgi:hypothetical protein
LGSRAGFVSGCASAGLSVDETAFK